MTKMTLVLDVYISNLKSKDPKTMLYGGEGLLFIEGKTPIKTAYRKPLHKIPKEKRTELHRYFPDMLITTYLPSYYLRIESVFYLDPNEIYYLDSNAIDLLANELISSIVPSRFKWYNSRWTYNLLNNDILINTNNPIRDISLIIKKLYSKDADFAHESIEQDYHAQPTNPIKNAYLMDHLNQIYPLSALKMQSYCNWSDIPSQYI